jgi:outer membrane protein OmpU
MKKVLLSGAALLAMTAGVAQAEGLTLDLGGHFKGYGVYNNNDEAAGVELDTFNIRKETELHFTGETTLDNGLTVGVHTEFNVDRDDNGSLVEEVYMYLSGGWGRVNFGEEDGAAYLLQVSAPNADANVDGLRQYISSYDSAGNGTGTLRLDYDHVAPASVSGGTAGKYNNKLTYMTPVMNGFQAGVSYIPQLDNDGNGTTATGAGNTVNEYEDGYELAARYEGEFEGVGVAFGAGYGLYTAENETAGSTVSDDATTWNAGLDLDFSGFGLGVAYLDQTTENATVETEVTTMVVGADYQMGAYKLGASWLNQETETAGTDTEIDRYTVGAGYSYGPGMSFRGSVSMIDNDNNIDSTQVLLGTQVNF